MDEKYHPQTIELKWQKYWAERGLHTTRRSASGQKFYCLEMFPYPSGEIHMGHVRNYAIGDVIARYKRMCGYDVLHPMGWDAFGLPAENAAIKHGVHPATWTYRNIQHMKQQLDRMGLSYDWDREVTTCRPEYYRWNQWFFLKMFERGLAYRKHAYVNWCTSCATVLANEQVIDDKCWRCESAVIQKKLMQWFFKITDYAEDLLRGCDALSGWPERVVLMQRNWIGRGEGVEVDFPLVGFDEKLRIFTTRPDTLFGVTFMCVAPGHPIVPLLVSDREAVEAVTAKYGKETEKVGLPTGQWCINPLNGEKIPIYIANFVLMEYGTGAIMSVPAHDQRDYEFAKKYGLPIKVVIVPSANGSSAVPNEKAAADSDLTEAYEGEGILVDSGIFSGMHSERARGEIIRFIESEGLGRAVVHYKLRDWGISRQRYWGTPIPIIYCEACGTVPVPEADLPVVLPEDVTITGKGSSPLRDSRSFFVVPCPICGRQASRETDTMDTFVDSSWYFIRYCLERGDIDVVSEMKRPDSEVRFWMPVDQYIGGVEHAVLHLLYSRFFTRVLRDLGLIDISEPFTNLLTQGMVIKDGAKMSKSRGNVVDPQYLIDRYGADTARLFSLFAAPPEKDLEWADKGVDGAFRFLSRLWGFVYRNRLKIGEARRDLPMLAALTNRSRALYRKTHKTIQKVTTDIEREYHFNTAIAAMMELLNEITAFEPVTDEDWTVVRFSLERIILLLSPFCPHISEELWEAIGNVASVFEQQWPSWDEEAAREELIELVIQVNGKVRSKVMIPVGMSDDELKTIALSDKRIQAVTNGKMVRKVVVVKGKLVNIVVGQ